MLLPPNLLISVVVRLCLRCEPGLTGLGSFSYAHLTVNCTSFNSFVFIRKERLFCLNQDPIHTASTPASVEFGRSQEVIQDQEKCVRRSGCTAPRGTQLSLSLRNPSQAMQGVRLQSTLASTSTTSRPSCCIFEEAHAPRASTSLQPSPFANLHKSMQKQRNWSNRWPRTSGSAHLQLSSKRKTSIEATSASLPLVLCFWCFATKLMANLVSCRWLRTFAHASHDTLIGTKNASTEDILDEYAIRNLCFCMVIGPNRSKRDDDLGSASHTNTWQDRTI
jgi:hypothetical protein